MKKCKRILLLSVILLALAFLFCIFKEDLAIAGLGVTAVKAELYVNGELLEMPAFMYWYVDPALGGAQVQFPLYSTLESLGCQIERQGQNDTSSTMGRYSYTTVRAGSHVFVIKENSASSDLFENDRQIYSDIAQRERHFGGRKARGQLYLDDSDYEKVLTILGFDQITCEINEEERIVRLSAVGPRDV